MKTLKDHTILYDEVCPLCNLYTNAFVQTGILDKEGRHPYQTLPENYSRCIDRKRAVDEIALVNRTTGQVHYGIYSLFFIIGHTLPFLKPLFRWRPFAWTMGKAYRFVSFNRRVIMPSDRSEAESNPSFNLRYRIAYLLFAWLLAAVVLSRYSCLLIGILPEGSFYRGLLFCGGQMVWQGLIVLKTDRQQAWEYLGTMMTVSLGGALLLLPALLVGRYTVTQPYPFAGWLLLAAGLMLPEHIRRVKVLGLNKWLSATWLIYWIIIILILCKSFLF